MKILVIIPPFTAIPAVGQGGTERIAEGTINELLKRGHGVTLIGCGDCQTKAEFIQIFSKTISEQKFNPALTEASRPLQIETAYITIIMKYLIDHDDEYDLIVNNLRGGHLLLPLAEFLKTPTISILHLPLFDELIEALSQFKKPNLISISDNQRQPANGKVNFLSTVYNGLDLGEFPFNSEPEDYFLFMGSIGEHKSPHLAIEACEKAGVKLVLAGGKVREPYFSHSIKPHLNENISYIGEVSGPDRTKLFQNAKALLMPITWEEPFGLVVIEAMACGTPAIAFNHGAMCEIISDGVDGYVVDGVEQMVVKMGEINKIDRSKARQKIEDMFTYQKMVDGYEEAYKKIKASGG